MSPSVIKSYISIRNDNLSRNVLFLSFLYCIFADGKNTCYSTMDKNKRNLIIIISVAVVAIISLLVLYFVSRSQMQEMVDVLSEEKTTLMVEFEELYLDYDSLNSNNDELNNRLEMERERIAQLTEEIKTIKATNARRIKELQGELTTMRTVMRSFVKQIDSLNTINVRLTQENKDMRTKVAQINRENDNLIEQNSRLNEQVEIAARLETTSVSAIGLTFKDKKTSSCSRVSKIKVSFVIAKNISAQVGMRHIYLRITRPDGQLLMHSKDDLFAFEDTQINYSSTSQVEYGGEETSAYIVYNVDAGELMGGEYEAELFCETGRLGSCRLTLKD